MQAHRHNDNTSTAFLSDAEVLEAANDLVEDFLELATHLCVGQDFLDISALLTSKQTLENAFRLEIATSMQSARRRRLIQAGTLLAEFQPDVGRRISLSPAASPPGQRSEDVMFVTKVEKILTQAQADRQRLSDLFEYADSVARRRYASSAHPPFYEDGTYSWHGHGTAH